MVIFLSSEITPVQELLDECERPGSEGDVGFGSAGVHKSSHGEQLEQSSVYSGNWLRDGHGKLKQSTIMLLQSGFS